LLVFIKNISFFSHEAAAGEWPASQPPKKTLGDMNKQPCLRVIHAELAATKRRSSVASLVVELEILLLGFHEPFHFFLMKLLASWETGRHLTKEGVWCHKRAVLELAATARRST
jgi:hypothetical protein